MPEHRQPTAPNAERFLTNLSDPASMSPEERLKVCDDVMDAFDQGLIQELDLDLLLQVYGPEFMGRYDMSDLELSRAERQTVRELAALVLWAEPTIKRI